MKTESISSVIKITNNFAILFPAGKLDSCNPETNTAVKDARVLMSKLERLKAFGNAFASIEVSPYVKELIDCKGKEFFKEPDHRNVSVAG